MLCREVLSKRGESLATILQSLLPLLGQRAIPEKAACLDESVQFFSVPSGCPAPQQYKRWLMPPQSNKRSSSASPAL